jgi:hypothetical protein
MNENGPQGRPIRVDPGIERRERAGSASCRGARSIARQTIAAPTPATHEGSLAFGAAPIPRAGATV